VLKSYGNTQPGGADTPHAKVIPGARVPVHQSQRYHSKLQPSLLAYTPLSLRRGQHSLDCALDIIWRRFSSRPAAPCRPSSRKYALRCSPRVATALTLAFPSRLPSIERPQAVNPTCPAPKVAARPPMIRLRNCTSARTPGLCATTARPNAFTARSLSAVRWYNGGRVGKRRIGPKPLCVARALLLAR
jgi:hypothetical protein